MYGDHGQALNAYYLELYSLWFFLIVLFLRLILFFFTIKFQWRDLLLLIPLFWIFFGVLG
jgi:hypothetical protein